MSRNTSSVSRAKSQLGRVKAGLAGMKKDTTDARTIHEANLLRWERHFEDLVTYRQSVLARRIKARENKKPKSFDEAKIAMKGKMRNGMLIG